MANITPRRNKNGNITSYTIRVHRGYDNNGKQLKPYIASFKPEKGMTAKQIAKELNRFAVKFEEQCKQGYQIDNRQTFAEYAEYVIQLKERSGVKHNTIYLYRKLTERINQGIGFFKLADIRPQHLNALYSQLAQSGLRENDRTAKAKLAADGGTILAARLKRVALLTKSQRKRRVLL